MKHYLRNLFYLILAACVSIANAGAYEDFFRAVDIDNDRSVRSLLAQGFDPNARNEQGQVALFLAMRENSPKVATALLAHPDIKIDATNAVGETPLMMAALKGRLDWTERLIARGAQVERPGWTPLHYAATGPEPRAVALLLDRGAAIDAPSPNHTTPLMMAARYGEEASVDLLLARGANPRLRNDLEQNAADMARLASRDALAARLEQRAR
jgi:ankyrin repeat protein